MGLSTGPSDPFELGRGVLQGDPASTILYAICLQPLLNAFAKTYDDMFGWHYHDKSGTRLHVPYLAYADDLVLFLEDRNSLTRMQRLFDQYEVESGARLSQHKATITWIAHPDSREDEPAWSRDAPFGRWADASERSLGFHFDRFGNISQDEYNKVIQRCCVTLQSWASAELTMLAKAQTFNSHLISRLTYISSTGFRHPQTLAMLQREARHFFFPQSRGIAMLGLAKHKRYGGLGILEIDGSIRANKVHTFMRQLKGTGTRALLLQTLLQQSFLENTRVHPYYFMFYGYRRPLKNSID